MTRPDKSKILTILSSNEDNGQKAKTINHPSHSRRCRRRAEKEKMGL
jgi:hypothetical protein